MKFVHTGLGAASEDNADRFFVNILGLKKSVPKFLNKEMTLAIFGISEELLIINYKNEDIHYEILIYEKFKVPDKQITHSCLQVNDLRNIVDNCRKAGLKVAEVPKGTGVVTFISDFDGNLFEMKEEQSR
ncbi:MAG: VOC family protein [Ignavibacteriaceae bacterium]